MPGGGGQDTRSTGEVQGRACGGGLAAGTGEGLRWRAGEGVAAGVSNCNRQGSACRARPLNCRDQWEAAAH